MKDVDIFIFIQEILFFIYRLLGLLKIVSYVKSLIHTKGLPVYR